MKIHKAQGMDGTKSDIITFGGQIVLTYLKNIFKNILKTKQIPDSWYEAKIVTLFKRTDPKDIKYYMHSGKLYSFDFSIIQFRACRWTFLLFGLELADGLL